MIITIAGQPGSGKSTAAEGLADKLGLNHYSVGNFRRKAAEKGGMTINEYNRLGEEDFSTDREADDWQKNLAKQDNFVIDGRLSFFFISNSIKVFLKVKPETAAERMFKQKRKYEKFRNVEEAVKSNKQRQDSDIKRYKKYYNINPFDEKHYDIIIDTTKLTIQKTVDKIAEEIGNRNL